jgi:ATP-dependent helicase/DNAse subunit B
MTVRLLDELTDLERLSLTPLSYSRLNTYKMCEAMYFYSYIQKEESLFGEAAKLGNIIHAVLENLLEPDQPVDKSRGEEYIDEFLKQRDSYDPDKIISDRYIEIGFKILEDFLDKHHGEAFPIIAKEMGFEIVVGSALLRGYIDRVDISNNTLYITDYKSGSREVAAKNVPDDLQLGIYALAMKKFYPDKDVYAELYYLKSGRQKGHLFTDGDLEAVESRLLDLVNEIIYKKHFKTTSDKSICSFCDHAKSGVCPTGAKRRPR